MFAGIALLLAVGGSYGVTSYLAAQRTRELGIRVALGARRRDISRAVLKGSVAIIGIGVVAAFGISGLLANWLPARRASRVDPMASLRGD